MKIVFNLLFFQKTVKELLVHTLKRRENIDEILA